MGNTPQYQQQIPQVTKQVLEAILRNSGGVLMKPYELDMVIMEFESLQVKGQLDFESFEKEFV